MASIRNPSVADDVLASLNYKHTIICTLTTDYSRAVMILKPKPKTVVLRWNRTATEPRFSAAMRRFFSFFLKWPRPVTNVPKQQPNYRLSRTPASTVWSDQLIAQSGVARQPNYSPWQVDLCAAVGAVRTDAYIQVDSQPCRQICEWRGESRLIDAHVSMRCRPYLFAFDFSSWRRCYVPKSHVRCL